jgi:[acyl-carrier-protein] S-malonyltransferase/trans-AT polyketide synthase/acyltransferase/oxidoreductase domain-containing protein
MGRDFFDNVEVSRKIYEQASEVLKWDVARMCFGQDDRLNLTEYTQPCILTTEIAMLNALNAHYGFLPSYFGGHSLGEFTALVAAGVIPLSEALQVVQIRGRLMQEAVPVGIGAMSAIISENLDVRDIRDAIADLAVDVANENSAHQVVISGESSAVDEAESRLLQKTNDAKPLRFVQLNVSAPFHSRFMQPIEEIFRRVIVNIVRDWNPEKASIVTSNFDGGFHSTCPEDIIDNLVFQLSHTVKWKENMKNLAARADNIYEIGPSRPLRDFFKSIQKECSSITTLATAERIFKGEK